MPPSITRSLSFALFALSLSPALGLAQETERPTNVLILLADDLGYMDVGFQNPETFYETPNLDALAASGVRFTQAYAACPVCSPTRASLLTGCYPARMATTDYFGAPQPDGILAGGRKKPREKWGRFQKLPLLPAAYVNQLPHERMTLAEALKEAGYATFFAGKWHLGGEGSSPTEHGFDVNVAGHHRGGPYGPGKYFHPFGMPNLESREGDHLPARLAEETVGFIRANKDRPFFAMLSFYSVHTPLMGRPDLVERYKAKKKRLGLEAAWGEEGERKLRLVQEHAVYAAMVHAMDEAAGVVLGALDELGLADDTIVVFFSDNGGLSTSEGHPTSNLPLRAGKGWLYEGGVREPCVIRWPGRARAGRVVDTPIVSTDVFPTVLEALGLPLRPDTHVDGESLAALLAGGSEPERDAIFWHYPHWGNQGGWPGSAIRAGDWKLIDFFGERASELYDLSDDPGETHDRAAGEPERAARLEARLAAWREDVGARDAIANPLLEQGGGRPMKVYLSADIEGVCGITDWSEADLGHEGYPEFRERMTAEVVAACEGALAAGATEILVNDSHASGRNVWAEELPREARLLRGWSGHPNCMVQEIDDTFDAALFVGWHSAGGKGGNPLAHTLNSRRIASITVNDEVASEFLIHAQAAALVSVPVVFVSGDEELCAEVKAYEERIETAPVTRGIGASMIGMHPAEAREAIRAGVGRALEGDVRELLRPLPKYFQTEVRFKDARDAYRQSFYPGAHLESPTSIVFETDDWFEVLRLLQFVS